MRILVGVLSILLAFVALIQGFATGIVSLVTLSGFGSGLAVTLLCLFFVIAGILALAGKNSRGALTVAAIFYAIAAVLVFITGNWIWGTIATIFAIIMIYYISKPQKF